MHRKEFCCRLLQIRKEVFWKRYFSNISLLAFMPFVVWTAKGLSLQNCDTLAKIEDVNILTSWRHMPIVKHDTHHAGTMNRLHNIITKGHITLKFCIFLLCKMGQSWNRSIYNILCFTNWAEIIRLMNYFKSW